VLVVGGLGNGLVQPAAGRLIAAHVPVRRRSSAAGAIGAALGAATLVPGLLVAVVVPAQGWRTAAAIAGLIALVPVVACPLTRGTAGPAVERAGPAPTVHRTRGVLVLWGLAAALSATGNNAVATYFVQLGAHSGLSAAGAGSMLSFSAVLAIAVRLVAGVLTDRAPHRNPAVITVMMLAGGFGLALVALSTPVTFVLGAVLAFSAGWGWTGLLLATALRVVGGRAENAGHTVQMGLYTGATIAPYTFAALSDAFGFAAAALTAATLALAAAGAMSGGALLMASGATTRRPPPSTAPCTGACRRSRAFGGR
jgi:cyanate permease